MVTMRDSGIVVALHNRVDFRHGTVTLIHAPPAAVPCRSGASPNRMAGKSMRNLSARSKGSPLAPFCLCLLAVALALVLSPACAADTLVSTGAVWKYLD